MNNPSVELEPQLEFATEHDFDFIDLTLEPPCAARTRLNPRQVRAALDRAGISAVGHTAWYLPLDLPFSGLQRAVADEINETMRFFSEAEIDRMTLHFFIKISRRMFSDGHILSFFRDTLLPVDQLAPSLGVTPMLENTFMDLDLFRTLGDLLEQLPNFAFHLDVGHVNLGGARPGLHTILRRFGSRLKHVHLSDNVGDTDLHLPLGCGSIDWQDAITQLKHLPYDDTITLEVFSPEKSYLLLSKRLLEEWWRQAD